MLEGQRRERDRKASKEDIDQGLLGEPVDPSGVSIVSLVAKAVEVIKETLIDVCAKELSSTRLLSCRSTE